MQQMDNFLLFLAITVGLIFLIAGVTGVIVEIRRRRTWRRGTATAVGEVERVDSVRGDHMQSRYALVLERRDANGVLHQCESTLATSRLRKPKFPFEVEVFIDANDESKFDTVGANQSKIGLFIVFSVTGFLMAGGRWILPLIATWIGIER